MSKINWLHLSDLHFGSKARTDLFYAALLHDIGKVISETKNNPNFIVLTGDIAFSGQSQEYEQAVLFLDNLLKITNIEKSKVLIVPGNHDLQWVTESPKLTNRVLKLTYENVNSILDKEITRTEALGRLNDYRNFICNYFGEIECPEPSQYFFVKNLNISNKVVAVLCLNSILLSNPNPYRNLVALGERQVRESLEKAKTADVRIAIMHHSLDSLLWKEQQTVVPELRKNCHFLLHGHLHRPGLDAISSHDSLATVIGAGNVTAALELASCYNLTSLDLEKENGSVYFRKYSSERGGEWGPDRDTYRNVIDGVFKFFLSSQLSPETTIHIYKPNDYKGKSLCIMHLSDLQFGRHHVPDSGREALYSDESSYDMEINKITADIKRVKKAYGISPNFIVVTGDLAEWSLEVEYQFAERFLDSIVKTCDISRENVVIVPGNHDINRNLCQAERLTFETLGKKFIPPYFKKFQLYEEFFNGFYRNLGKTGLLAQTPRFDEKLFVNYYYENMGVLFYGLNSCVMESELDSDHYGWISIDQVNRSIRDSKQYETNGKIIKIAIMHHNFYRDSSYDNENLRDADDLVIPLSNANIKLLLHGHQHIPKATITGIPGNPIHVLATGSAGLDANALPENARRYQYIMINERDVHIYRRRFEKQVRDETGKGCWVADPIPEDSPLYKGGPANISFEM